MRSRAKASPVLLCHQRLATCQLTVGCKEYIVLDLNTDAVFSPWAKPRGMFQMMARYQALKVLKPVGPDRPLADSLRTNITCKCDTCNGTGLHGTYGGMGWRVCPTCHGMGETYSITLEELQALLQQVLDRYPPELYNQKCAAVFEHVYESYPERNAGVYA
jgi:hypothetical protein